jgi:hypothetical protein
VTVPRHPAKFSRPIIEAAIVEVSSWQQDRRWAPARLLDPFAGVGRCHDLGDVAGIETVGVELEPEWAAADPRTIVGDALALPFGEAEFDLLFTSPCYGNRMADHHEARDACAACGGSGCRVDSCLGGHPDDGNDHGLCPTCGGAGLSKRNTYRHALGRPLSDGSVATMQWGSEYRAFHELAWREALRVLRPSALLLVNVSNHIRKGVEQPVVEWHLNEFLRHGCHLRAAHRIGTQRNRQGANGDARVDGELLLVLQANSNPQRRLL